MYIDSPSISKDRNFEHFKKNKKEHILQKNEKE